MSPAPGSKGPPRSPAVPIETSVTPDYIICLETGRKLVLLRRHLRETLHLTPEEYRARWGLPPEYPMAAPNYIRKRSSYAQ
ncbi:putative transcriptional regulator [Limimaricola variabilis]|uniref:Transcriptional regulator n=1 Tax=Limimaricola variabilis TaxID=1492771 RepID=A0ABR6HSK5_9RHOB|nr:MucR family transcriptional regulator [Limimaricola variabilis]MBB3713457.1 putative transcriptional regulator [Limimaricola variabilis]WPY94895.1 MucR family transcriptional regulator [Limimaricola variabilis]